MRSRDGVVKTYLTPANTHKVRFWCEDNKERNYNCKTKTERDALMRAVKKRLDLDFWFPPEESKTERHELGTFKGLADLWLEHSAKVREISESCQMNYVCHLKHHILPVIGDSFLKDLDIKSIEKVAGVIKTKRPQSRSYVAVRQNRIDNDEFFEDDEFLSTSYRREILTVACMVTKFGQERGYLTVNPFREFKLPKCPEQPYDYWRLDEEDKFLQWLEDGGPFWRSVAKPGSVKKGKPEYFDKKFIMRPGKAAELYDVVLFALRSGLRKGEIGALTRRDVNFGKNLIIVRRSYSTKERRMKKTTKGKTFRVVEMNEDMRLILKRRIARAKSDQDLLFDIGTWAVKNFSKYCEKAGVREIHFHSLRHTCLTNLANGYGMIRPVPLPQVQKIAGHREVSTTMRYVHTDGIENTSSLQLSREQRKAASRREENDPKEEAFGLRVISGGRN